jgi:CDP-diacylglycerol--glycerol-3-phosphate 3-phosphatidyltransferase
MRDRGSADSALRGSPLVPRALSDPLLRFLDRAAHHLVRAGISANAVTGASMALAVLGGVLLGLGAFVLATPAMVLACLGDALDGLVARRSATVSVGGALLDASVDRYGEFFFLGGLAVYFRASTPVLVLALLALAGSFMVSYASAKAEALRLPAPPGLMRRPERAIWTCGGVALTALLVALAPVVPLSWWTARGPVVAALGVLAVFANASAMRRLRSLAQSQSRPSQTAARDRVVVAALGLERVGANETGDPNAAVAAPRALRIH